MPSTGILEFGMNAKLARVIRERLASGRIVVANPPVDPDRGPLSPFELVSKMDDGPRIIWLALMEDTADQVLGDLVPLLGPFDIIIDVGDLSRAAIQQLARQMRRREPAIHLVDVRLDIDGDKWTVTAGGDRIVLDELKCRQLAALRQNSAEPVYTGRSGTSRPFEI